MYIQLTRICHRNVRDFIGVQPDFALPAAEHRSGEPLLQFQAHHRNLFSIILLQAEAGGGRGGGGCSLPLSEAAKRVENRKDKCGRAPSRVKTLAESNPRAVG
jgi:hypothetical protein